MRAIVSDVISPWEFVGCLLDLEGFSALILECGGWKFRDRFSRLCKSVHVLISALIVVNYVVQNFFERSGNREQRFERDYRGGEVSKRGRK